MPTRPPTFRAHAVDRRVADRNYNRRRRSDPLHADAERVHSSSRWQRVRAMKRRLNPICEACLAYGNTRIATSVDHVVGLRIDPTRAFDFDNLRSLCASCHGAKNGRERRRKGDGGGVHL